MRITHLSAKFKSRIPCWSCPGFLFLSWLSSRGSDGLAGWVKDAYWILLTVHARISPRTAALLPQVPNNHAFSWIELGNSSKNSQCSRGECSNNSFQSEWSYSIKTFGYLHNLHIVCQSDFPFLFKISRESFFCIPQVIKINLWFGCLNDSP